MLVNLTTSTPEYFTELGLAGEDSGALLAKGLKLREVTLSVREGKRPCVSLAVSSNSSPALAISPHCALTADDFASSCMLSSQRGR